MRIGTQWVNANGAPVAHGFAIDIDPAGIFVVLESTNGGETWRAITEFETVFDAVLYIVRMTEEAYAKTLAVKS